METMNGNYGKLLHYAKDGTSYFYMNTTKTPLPFESEYPFFYCSGKVPEYNYGYPLTLHGSWKQSDTGKWKFMIENYEEDIRSGQVLEDYIVSECPGVGTVTAKKISKLGKELWNIIKKENGVDEIAEKTKISYDICQTIINVLKKKEERYQLFQYLCQYGISDIKVDKLIEKFGINTLHTIKDDPYKMSCFHVSFAAMDEMAFTEGILHYDEKRIKGLLECTMKYFTNDGSTWVDIYNLYDHIEKISMKSIYRSKIPRALISLVIQKTKWLYIDKQNDRVYFKSIWDSENDIVKNIYRLNHNYSKFDFDNSDIEKVEKKLKINYANAQKNAFHILDDSKVKILTGGPGTGKTTVLNGILALYKEKYPENKIALCAPTGAAAEHMSDTTGHEASTIHRLLEYQPFCNDTDATFKNEQDQIDADFIIMDEASMTDTKLMAMFFNAVKSGTLVLICGDSDQLDSVGPGSVLYDLIQSQTVMIYRLDVLFRQKEESNIVYNAECVNKQDNMLRTGADFEIIRFSNQEQFFDIIKKQIQKNIIDDIFHLQILSTTQKSYYGTRSLNTIYQNNKTYTKGRTIHRNGYVLHTGDRIMTLKNNYQAGYFNGDIGMITEITDLGEVTISIQKKRIHMQNIWLEDIVPADAITIHKSQGNEFEVIIVVVPKNPAILLEKNIIYTAITRAKEKVIILSQDNALELAISNNKRIKRKTGLYEKLIQKKEACL